MILGSELVCRAAFTFVNPGGASSYDARLSLTGDRRTITRRGARNVLVSGARGREREGELRVARGAVHDETPVGAAPRIELAHAVTGELGLSIARVVVNGVLPKLFSADAGTELTRAVANAGANPPRVLASAVHRITRERSQADSLERITRELTAKPNVLPFLFESVGHAADLAKLAEGL